MSQRLIVFFDWQNVYKRARETFEGNDGPAYKGQVDPIDLARVLQRKYEEHHDVIAELEQIRVYRGRPTQQHDPKGYQAFRRQDSNWSRNNKLLPFYSDLRYPENWGQPGCDKPREKGVDVALAVDLVTLAHKGLMDAAIVMSADYDLLPAIETAVKVEDGPRVEVAAWKGQHDSRPLRIRRANGPLWCHWLSQQDYWGVTDDTDYALPAERPVRPVPGPPRRY
ncbi:NYN domain-containing protein [Microbacterium gilvum]|uniref:NYN domain-containing protein n=1 Tax=Microbacterium gilvum TaxID=1336204 RepID=A0ABP9A6L9_9MICO